MAAVSPSSPRPPNSTAGTTPSARLEVRSGGNETSYPVGDTGFLLGNVPGCDLRLPGAGMPPVLALVVPQPSGVHLRKLAPIGTLFLNSAPVVDAVLADGDQIVAGGVEITVRIAPSVPMMRVRLFDEVSERRERHDALTQERAELTAQAERNTRHERELNEVRAEMAEIRKQLHQRYRQRRDRLAGMQESIRRAGRRIQDEKRGLARERQRLEAMQAGGGAYESEMRMLAGQMSERAAQIGMQEEELRLRSQQIEAETRRRDAELATREKKLADETLALEKGREQHRTDLVRLDHLADKLEQRRLQIQTTALDVDRRYEALQRDTRELEEQASRLDEWQERLREKDIDGDRRLKELEAARAELTARTTAIEGQQAMLTALRTRLEKMREEHRRREQQIDEQKVRQDEAEAEIEERLAEARRLSVELNAEKQLRDEQTKRLEERKGVLESAIAQLRQSHSRLSDEVALLDQRRLELDASAARQQEEQALLESRQRQAEEELSRLRADRLALDDRMGALTRAEQVMAGLQEQVRRRADELAARQKLFDEQSRADVEARAAFEARCAAWEEERRRREDELNVRDAGFESEKSALADERADLESRELALRGEVQELAETRRTFEDRMRELSAEQARIDEERERLRRETETARAESSALMQQLPAMQRQADEALQRLTLAREQLRGHLAEIHEYIRRGRADLESMRDGLGLEQQRLGEAQDAHRLSVADFRQQLSEWQGRLAEMKMSMVQGESLLEERVAEVEQRARLIDTASQQLAEQADRLQKQEREVLERRREVENHLDDMRDWYRRKLRDLARVEGTPDAAADAETTPLTEARPGLFSMTGEVEPGDRRLGELMRSLELIDAETLTALLVEARRKRRSLRQLLLQAGYLTLFQLALIEAGNLDGLVLGPVRVIDRLYSTPQETAYRVFDPRTEREAVLRHLSEIEIQDAMRPDEFRQRFGSLVELRHPHLTATYEVLEIADRPAVLQERLSGLPSSDWPALSAVPGVWFRLLSQAAVGLKTIHEAGLIHGLLQPALVIATDDGVLKLCGQCEPAWLTGLAESSSDVGDDLRALGRCALAWSSPTSERKGPKPKPLPESLQTVLHRLNGDESAAPFVSAAELLDALDEAGRSVPANAAAWERFVRHVRDQASDNPLKRIG